MTEDEQRTAAIAALAALIEPASPADATEAAARVLDSEWLTDHFEQGYGQGWNAANARIRARLGL